MIDWNRSNFKLKNNKKPLKKCINKLMKFESIKFNLKNYRKVILNYNRRQINNK